MKVFFSSKKPKYRNTDAYFNILNKILKDYFELDMDYSQPVHILQEIKMLVASLCKGSFSCVRRSSNSVVHSLAKFAKSISDDVIWIEDPPLPALEFLFFDVNVYLL